MTVDLFALHKAEYSASKKPVLVKIGPARYLSIEGRSAPSDAAFQEAISALYASAWTIKMTRKFAVEDDFKVCALECLWWVDADGDFVTTPPSQWNWQVLMHVPQFVNNRDLARAKQTIEEKKKDKKKKSLPDAGKVFLITLKEGECVQMLHVGPYDQERESIRRMQEFAEAEGRVFQGKHHEIYLSDPRRVAPERLRTILRMPVKRAR